MLINTNILTPPGSYPVPNFTPFEPGGCDSPLPPQLLWAGGDPWIPLAGDPSISFHIEGLSSSLSMPLNVLFSPAVECD